MITSQNGYTANDRSLIASFTIPGTTRRVALRKGDTSVVLLDFLGWFDKNVESIDGGLLDDWGYAERLIRGSDSVVTNHASGTAVDVNAPFHPLGRRNTFSAADTAKIRAKLREYDGVIRWGGDYVSRADEMHFEINRGAAAVRTQADRIRGRASQVALPTPRVPADAPFGRTARGDRVLGLHDPLMRGDDVRGVRRAFTLLPGNHAFPVNDTWDLAAANLGNVFKAHRGITELGFGAQCWAEIRKVAHP